MIEQNITTLQYFHLYCDECGFHIAEGYSTAELKQQAELHHATFTDTTQLCSLCSKTRVVDGSHPEGN